jgi:hypothetical protein
MNPDDYLKKYYLKDLKRFGENILCGRTMSKFWNEKEREKWEYLDHFLVCQYELNLLSQIIYSNFKEDYEKWLEVSLPFVDCRCPSAHGGVGHPLSILWVAERDLSKKGPRFYIKKSLILEYDRYFLEYVKEICKKYKFIKLTPELLIEALKNDSDCNSERVFDYFNKKVD